MSMSNDGDDPSYQAFLYQSARNLSTQNDDPAPMAMEVGGSGTAKLEDPGTTKLQVPSSVGLGSIMPDFEFTSLDDQRIKLSDFRGKKVMLCFYNFYCPSQSYTIGELVGNYKKLAWASNLKVITVFPMDLEYLKKGFNNKKHIISLVTASIYEGGNYPFLAVADPNKDACTLFNTSKRNLLSMMFIDVMPCIPKVMRKYKTLSFFQMFGENVLWANNEYKMLPSEFLIDENGVLVDAFRASQVNQTIPVERISTFLLMGAKEKIRDRNQRWSKFNVGTTNIRSWEH